jgi:hypothetical protein
MLFRGDQNSMRFVVKSRKAWKKHVACWKARKSAKKVLGQALALQRRRPVLVDAGTISSWSRVLSCCWLMVEGEASGARSVMYISSSSSS